MVNFKRDIIGFKQLLIYNKCSNCYCCTPIIYPLSPLTVSIWIINQKSCKHSFLLLLLLVNSFVPPHPCPATFFCTFPCKILWEYFVNEEKYYKNLINSPEKVLKLDDCE